MSSINYDLKKIKGIVLDVDGVLSPSTIPMNENGEPIRMVNIKDGYVLQLAVKCGYKIAIITGAKNNSIILRYNALGILDVFIGASEKFSILQKWLDQNQLNKDEIIYIGDDIPDVNCMLYAGLPVAPNDACHDVKKIARYISHYDGGMGCVRDVLEQLLKANRQWLNNDDALKW